MGHVRRVTWGIDASSCFWPCPLPIVEAWPIGKGNADCLRNSGFSATSLDFQLVSHVMTLAKPRANLESSPQISVRRPKRGFELQGAPCGEFAWSHRLSPELPPPPGHAIVSTA